ncbi:HIRA-interacting protein 3 isoform X2 [Tamandua tetradactyla]|uniref:HIRA-interacting protein 3 isoform X2 n=1 Tax=Tamandua tetradactyla TaxID=48850 RepID=UPI004053E3D1
MARESEMQEFIRSLFRGRPDLSTLTHSIVRRRFLAHAGRDHLEPKEKQALKQLVEEELLKMQVDEAGAREKLDFRKKKRPPTPCSDPERKKFRFNSESEPISTASSPECFRPPAKNGMAAAEVSSAEEESSRRTSKKAIEESSDEDEQQRDLPAKAGLEKEVVKESSEEEGSVRMSKVWKEESSKEEENEEEEEKESKGRARKKTVTKNKQVPGKASANRKQTREENEDCEEEPAQRAGKKGEGKQCTKSHQENKKESEEGQTLAKKKENREEENWKPGAWSNGENRPAQEERSYKQKSRVGRLIGTLHGEKEKETAQNGDDSEGDEKPLVQGKNKDITQCKSGERQSGSSEEDGADSWKEVSPIVKGTRKAVKAGSISGEDSDLEREVSDSEVVGKPKEERKNRSSKKSSKKGRTRSSSSSSSDGSPEPRGGKANSGRHGEDHPAVMRLKRYIRACGAHRNYKKLLGSCRSHKERLSVLRAELEALGMKGNPSLEKCRALKEQREEAAEVASLDIANIISSSGRPRRRTAWNPSREVPSGELYRRTLDSEEELPHPPPPDWSHMRGIISSDGESN